MYAYLFLITSATDMTKLLQSLGVCVCAYSYYPTGLIKRDGYTVFMKTGKVTTC